MGREACEVWAWGCCWAWGLPRLGLVACASDAEDLACGLLRLGLVASEAWAWGLLRRVWLILYIDVL